MEPKALKNNSASVKQPLRPASYWLLVLGIPLLIAVGSGCIKDSEPETVKTPVVTAPVTTDTPIVPASNGGASADGKNIKDNPMHEAHLMGGGNECGDCHNPEFPYEHEESLVSCHECHQQTVVDPIWDNHCLTCHHFTYSNEIAASDPVKVAELCHDCHKGDDAKDNIYAFIAPDELHNITCERCHHPHEEKKAAVAEFCTECHPDLVGIKHPTVGGTTCEKCHNPHIDQGSRSDICISCHLPDERVLVHLIPSHPKDCMVCHSPHFDETEILGNSCLECHDGLFYSGGKNQPRQHKDCENCHWVSDFNYKGDEACGECHASEGAITDNHSIPAQHRNCLTCHHPHIWRAPFEQNCVSCHELDNVLEHQLEVHDFDCEECHDPHLTDKMPKSGHCSGCHGPQIPNFLPDVPAQHVECGNCHEDVDHGLGKYEFTGHEATCQVCHENPDEGSAADWSDLPVAHTDCEACHPAHHFPNIESETSTCEPCHADKASTMGSSHTGCFNCHVKDHEMEFQGQELTCLPCHAKQALQTAGTVKSDCMSCHPSHDFAAEPVACSTCHSDIGGMLKGSGMEDCSDCHGDHTWMPSRDTCIECHSEPSESHDDLDHKFCLDCHGDHDYSVE